MPQMSDELWKRHANPWSVWTRFAAIPVFMLAVWSRVWIGWWALVPVFLVVAWLYLNVLVFSPVSSPQSWASRGIYGEKLWLKRRKELPKQYDTFQKYLITLGVAGMIFIAAGLYLLHLWAGILGAVILTLSQLWRIDRFGTLYEIYGEKKSKLQGQFSGKVSQ